MYPLWIFSHPTPRGLFVPKFPNSVWHGVCTQYTTVKWRNSQCRERGDQNIKEGARVHPGGVQSSYLITKQNSLSCQTAELSAYSTPSKALPAARALTSLQHGSQQRQVLSLGRTSHPPIKCLPEKVLEAYTPLNCNLGRCRACLPVSGRTESSLQSLLVNKHGWPNYLYTDQPL